MKYVKKLAKNEEKPCPEINRQVNTAKDANVNIFFFNSNFDISYFAKNVLTYFLRTNFVSLL